MRKWCLPLTYRAKIPKVLSGKCTQTIRPGGKFLVGDLVMFHGWEGKPYRSKWSFRTPYWNVVDSIPIKIYLNGIRPAHKSYDGPLPWLCWHNLAKKDGIDPPTGEELGRVLRSMHKIPSEGLPAQIIRWEYK